MFDNTSPPDPIAYPSMDDLTERLRTLEGLTTGLPDRGSNGAAGNEPPEFQRREAEALFWAEKLDTLTKTFQAGLISPKAYHEKARGYANKLMERKSLLHKGALLLVEKPEANDLPRRGSINGEGQARLDNSSEGSSTGRSAGSSVDHPSAGSMSTLSNAA